MDNFWIVKEESGDVKEFHSLGAFVSAGNDDRPDIVHDLARGCKPFSMIALMIECLER
jgi:hypothetical protein